MNQALTQAISSILNKYINDFKDGLNDMDKVKKIFEETKGKILENIDSILNSYPFNTFPLSSFITDDNKRKIKEKLKSINIDDIMDDDVKDIDSIKKYLTQKINSTLQSLSSTGGKSKKSTKRRKTKRTKKSKKNRKSNRRKH
jgi:hypothetical protein